jgi:hypothetical protein
MNAPFVKACRPVGREEEGGCLLFGGGVTVMDKYIENPHDRL